LATRLLRNLLLLLRNLLLMKITTGTIQNVSTNAWRCR
jgi:hypothetical protein